MPSHRRHMPPTGDACRNVSFAPLGLAPDDGGRRRGRRHVPPCPGLRQRLTSHRAHKSEWTAGHGRRPPETESRGARTGTRCCRRTRPKVATEATGGDGHL